MEVFENRALILRTHNPGKYAVIPNSMDLGAMSDGAHEVAVQWELDAIRVLRNLGVKDAPSPILGRYDWPGRYKPFTHQRDTSAFLTLNNRAFVFSEPGTGKTLSAIWAADYLMKIGRVRKVLILCPLSIMQSAWQRDITSSAIHRTVVVCHHVDSDRRVRMVEYDYDFTIVNYDGLPMVVKALQKRGNVDLVIVDECFVKGTKIATPSGERAIETLAAGEEVLTSNGVTRIRALVRNTTQCLVTLKLSNGKKIRCTPDHPFFTDVGWVTAEEALGRRLVHATELPNVQQHLRRFESLLDTAPSERYGCWDDLQQILHAEAVACATSGGQLLQ